MIFHDLRRSAVTRYQQLALRPQLIRKLAGHQTIAMRDRYGQVTDEEMAVALGQASDLLRKQVLKIA